MSKFVEFGRDGASSDREVEIESEREIQSNREGETVMKIGTSDVNSDGEIDSESE
jgi:hypothetical protein